MKIEQVILYNLVMFRSLELKMFQTFIVKVKYLVCFSSVVQGGKYEI